MPVLFFTSTLSPEPKGRELLLERLILSIAEKDTSALEQFYIETNKSVYGYALTLLKNAHDAADAVSETFLKVWQGAHGYEPQGKPMAWLITIAKNVCREILRKRALAPTEEVTELIAAPDDFAPNEDKWVLEQYLSILSDEEREIIMMHTLGFKHRETAYYLGLPLSTVLSKYHRGLKKLKEKFVEGGILK